MDEELVVPTWGEVDPELRQVVLDDLIGYSTCAYDEGDDEMSDAYMAAVKLLVAAGAR